MKTKGWMGTVALAALLGATGCSKNEGDGGGGGGSSNASKLEEYAMTPEWINYATAVSSELLDDCVGLWASWNGPSGIPDEDWNRIGRDFFSKNTIVGADGYAQYMRTASEGNDKFTSGVDAIRTILVDGFANISNEVGSSKIGNPNSLALSGQTNEAVLFGPAGEETGLGFDPSMDSWPLDQEDIATIITNKNLSSVDDYIGAIGSESVRGFHTIELLLFKDGQNRKVLAE